MDDFQSKAIGINFLELCNDPAIGDACHIAACELMAEGYGYGGEGDWTTAMMGYALAEAGCRTSFTEMFSVGYGDHRIVLRHWGEGNCQLARGRATLEASVCSDKQPAKFAVMSFEFQPGEVMLVNVNTTPLSEGQLISIGGEISDESLPGCNGPRGIFRPDSTDAAELLTGYAYSGGSHHLTMIYGDESGLLNAFSTLAGWNYFRE